MKKALLILFFIALCTPVFAQQCTTKAGYPAAIYEADLNRAFNCILSKDYVALTKLIESGRVIMLRAGVVVMTEDYKFFKGIVKIRPRGENLTVWTNIEAVDCK